MVGKTYTTVVLFPEILAFERNGAFKIMILLPESTTECYPVCCKLVQYLSINRWRAYFEEINCVAYNM